MIQTVPRLGPKDHGRRMSLADFEFAKVKNGYLYELSRGVITVAEIPNPPQGAVVDNIRMQIDWYRRDHPGVINSVRAGSDCKILAPDFDSERHPDLAVYKKRPPGDNRETWRIWIPELVVEVVSLGSRVRDYQEKREEYLRVGIKEYWIVDEKKGCMTVLKRRGQKWTERIVHPGEIYQTRLVPGFEFNLAQALAAAE